MARWLPVLAVGGEAGTTTWLANVGGFLLRVTCVLVIVAVFIASCTAHFHRSETGFKFANKIPYHLRREGNSGIRLP